MNSKFKNAFSLIEIAFIVFILFFIYTFVVKQIIADMKYSDTKRAAATTYNKLNIATRNLMGYSNFVNRFRTEYDIVNYYAKDMQAETICKNAKKEECWSANWMWAEISKPGFKLPSGEYVVSELTSARCISNLNIPNTCGALYVDTNGSKAPNSVGIDIIKIYITKDGLVPAGVKEDIINSPKSCDMVKKFTWGCTARLLGIR